MKGIALQADPNVIVGIDSSDDAGVYRISDTLALVQTVDYITPIVDDPFVFGQIAACNSLSDVYAMGGVPLTALNVVCFPTKKFTLDVMGEILRGGISIIESAGVRLLGGHSVEDNELKYGLSVTGTIHPDRVIRNIGIREGDALILTKPLGTGIIATALKAGLAAEDIIPSFAGSMATLNRKAAEIMTGFNVRACTDITGFGLLGHLKEMLGGDNLRITINSGRVPLLPGARANAAQGMIPGGMYRNRDFAGSICLFDESVPRDIADILFDPQTSGGLCIAVPEHEAPGVVSRMHEEGIAEASLIGHVEKDSEQRIRVL